MDLRVLEKVKVPKSRNLLEFWIIPCHSSLRWFYSFQKEEVLFPLLSLLYYNNIAGRRL